MLTNFKMKFLIFWWNSPHRNKSLASNYIRSRGGGGGGGDALTSSPTDFLVDCTLDYILRVELTGHQMSARSTADWGDQC